MKASRLFDKITENWIAKIVCFAIALVLYGAHLTLTLNRRSFAIPLALSDSGALCALGDFPENVRVNVRTTADNMAETLESDFTAELDITQYGNEGEYSVPVTLRLAPKLLLMDPFEVRVEPESVTMRLEEKTLKFVNVVPSIAGDVEHGYSITSTTVEPAVVQITGPRSVIEETGRVYTSAVDVNGISSSRNYDVSIRNINSLIEMADADSVFRVSVTVAPEPLTRSVANMTVSAMFLLPELEVQGELPQISFDLTGTVPALENYTPDENAVFVDCSAISGPGTYELPVRFSLPENVRAANRSADTVSITVVERQTEESRVDADSEESLVEIEENAQ